MVFYGEQVTIFEDSFVQSNLLTSIIVNLYNKIQNYNPHPLNSLPTGEREVSRETG